MKISQEILSASGNWKTCSPPLAEDPQLVLLFGSTQLLTDKQRFQEIRAKYPQALLFGCSTAGEISGAQVTDDTIALTAIHFQDTPLKMVITTIDEASQSRAAGEHLAKSFTNHADLLHVLVLSDGLQVNGTELVNGLTAKLPAKVTVTGGLSGDGANFSHTVVCANNIPTKGIIAALGFYGKRLKVGFGSLGGWDSFGPERRVTRSKGNVLYELDGKSALALYKKYLGEHATGLPATGLLFPLSIGTSDSAQPVVRTILSVNESEQSMTFAGDIPQGAYAHLMKANFERLIDGAMGAAQISTVPLLGSPAQLALLISCVGRKLVLKQRIEEEVKSVRNVFGEQTVLTGFYSYGEISPHTQHAKCELHNQTMTITTFAET